MKRATVPVQVTTEEDRLIGNLSPTQTALFTAPLVICFVGYVFLPPNFELTPYKVVIAALFELMGGLLAFRFRDRIILDWFTTISRYNLRPRHYVYRKHDLYMRKRPVAPKQPAEATQAQAAGEQKIKAKARPSVPAVVKAEAVMTDPRAKLRFKAGKGRLNVVVQEIK